MASHDVLFKWILHTRSAFSEEAGCRVQNSAMPSCPMVVDVFTANLSEKSSLAVNLVCEARSANLQAHKVTYWYLPRTPHLPNMEGAFHRECRDNKQLMSRYANLSYKLY